MFTFNNKTIIAIDLDRKSILVKRLILIIIIKSTHALKRMQITG